MLVLGVDPGINGAWAILDSADDHFIQTGQWHGCIQTLEEFGPWDELVGRAYIEKVHAMPRQGVTSVFTFGENFGCWQGILSAEKIPYEFVTPRTWQKAVVDGLPTKAYGAESETEEGRKRITAAHKKALKDAIHDFTKRRFPHRSIRKFEADAICIALYGAQQVRAGR